MSASRTNSFMTIRQGKSFLVLPGVAMLDLKSENQVRSLLNYRKWKEVVFAEALATDPTASNGVSLTTLMQELNKTQPSTPLTVVTAGTSCRARHAPRLSTRMCFQGVSTWA